MSNPLDPFDRVRAARARAARAALDVVGGTKDLLLGLLEVVEAIPELDVDEDDEDISFLLDVATEIEDLPIGAERNAWPHKLLAEADREIANTKRLYRNDLLAVFRRLVQRFAAERRATDS